MALPRSDLGRIGYAPDSQARARQIRACPKIHDSTKSRTNDTQQGSRMSPQPTHGGTRPSSKRGGTASGNTYNSLPPHQLPRRHVGVNLLMRCAFATSPRGAANACCVRFDADWKRSGASERDGTQANRTAELSNVSTRSGYRCGAWFLRRLGRSIVQYRPLGMGDNSGADRERALDARHC